MEEIKEEKKGKGGMEEEEVKQNKTKKISWEWRRRQK